MHVLGTSRRPDLPLAVVIGAGTMGMAVARRMAQGHRVLLADIDGAKAEREAAQMCEEGCDATGIACDVTDPAAVAALAKAVADGGGLRALAHVAGISPSLGNYRTIMRVNLMGMALVAEALLPLAGPGTAAVLIASLAAHNHTPSDEAIAVLHDPANPEVAERLEAVIGTENATPAAAYMYSKWALRAYARRNVTAWAARGARIMSLSPGMIATTQGAVEFEKSPGKKALFEKSPFPREGTMLEIADAVEFLVSPRASFISGSDLLVDGGLNAAISEV